MGFSSNTLGNSEIANEAGASWWERKETGIAAVVFLFLLIYLPFIGKAFHIDDLAFINMSKMIGWNPLHAIPTDSHFEGLLYPKYIPYEVSHPLLVPYIIKIVTAVFGENEVALHAAFMIFPLIALFSLIKLNNVLFAGSGNRSILLALFFCSVPAFLVNSQNVMTDVPTLAFLLLAMACFFDGLENGSQRMNYLGGVALTLSIFCSYQMLAFIPLIFLYALWRRKVTLHVFLSMALPAVCVLAWLLAVYSLYDVFPVLKSKVTGTSGDIGNMIKNGLGSRTMFKKGFSVFALIGAATIFVLPLHYALKKSLGKFFLLFVALIPVFHLATSKLTRYPLGANLIFSAFVSLGAVTVLTLVWTVWQRMRQGEGAQREVFLMAWVLCVIGYAIVLLPFSAARYILPLFPPTLMLLMSDPAWEITSRARRIGVASMLCCSLLFGMASSFSDFKYAESYREFATFVKNTRSSAGNTFDVWYIGEWGMHYYMDKAGARYLHADSNEPKTGDYVVIPDMPRLWQPSLPLQYRMALSTEQSYKSWLPLRLFNKRSFAGFYCHGWGMLPFCFSDAPDEVFAIFKVIR